VDQAELLSRVTSLLTELRIPYLVTGSMATIAYGEPRLTIDIDIVVRLRTDQVDTLYSNLSDPELYVSRTHIHDAVSGHTQFNILHPTSGLKVDVMVADESDFNRSRFARARTLEIGGGATAVFASPEDVILKKLEYYRAGGSDKHLRDIAGVLRITGESLDFAYLERWAKTLGVPELWAQVRDRVDHHGS